MLSGFDATLERFRQTDRIDTPILHVSKIKKKINKNDKNVRAFLRNLPLSLRRGSTKLYELADAC